MRRSFMARGWLIVLLLGGMFCPMTRAVWAQIDNPSSVLRVSLASNLTSADFAVSDGSYQLQDYMTRQVIANSANQGVWAVAPAGGSKIQISNSKMGVSHLASNKVYLRQGDPAQTNTFRYKTKRYRGDLLIENINGRLHVINVLDVEHYLYGVVGPELGLGAPEEAYKAQAVVSRTYALYYKEHPQVNYDLGITTQWQVYSGYDMELTSGALVKKAVDDTKGEAVFYDHKLIQAFFHANSGGYTEACENVWFNNLPYIQPVPAPEDAVATQVTQRGTWPADTYQWEKAFTRAELNSRIQQWNKERPDSRINIGDIKSLVPTRQAMNPLTRDYLPTETRSGRVTQLDFVGTKGVKSFYRDGIRPVLGLRSTLFNITYDSTVNIWDALGRLKQKDDGRDLLGVSAYGQTGKLNGNNGNYYVITASGVQTQPKQFTQIVIRGNGYGHGLGMSQWGAWGMALQGSNYKKIIEHYYNQGKNDGRLQIRGYQQQS